jgi:methyltransferase (TIGR00027 family)
VENQSSQTAFTAAAARAAHLIVDAEPYIFADTVAEAMLGDRAGELLAYHRLHGDHPVLAGARAQVLIRARVAEHLLGESGVEQYVILGAGLDSFAYRSPLARELRVFEVDHPATQAVKRDRLAAAGLRPLTDVRHVPVDLEADRLLPHLAAHGFDAGRPAFVSWLGVSMYLTREAVGATLDQVAELAPGSRLVLDHMVPAGLRDAAGQTYVDLVAPHAAESGEPWLSFFAPDEMAGLLAGRGFGAVRGVDQRDALEPELWQRTDALRPAKLSMIVSGCRE